MNLGTTGKLLEQTDPENLLNAKDSKTFTFRALDPVLHTTWKTCAAMAGVSMEEFGVAAIRAYIKRSIEGDSEKATS